mmetsp:Transcript_12721/g.18704  ORF Transcript_12721/g.18704 Transcript_12721/m.18704 type:complete len:199 (-) Transcript_12721:341-937(-)
MIHTRAIPNFVKAGLQSSSIMVVADIATQLLIEGKQPITWNNDFFLAESNSVVESHYDIIRTARWASVGLFMHGPYFYTSFSKLDKLFGGSTSFANVVKKTAFGQVVIFPPYLVMLFTYMGIWQTTDPKLLWDYVWNRVPNAFLGGCVFWPAANMINFALVPSTLRVPYLAALGSVWNVFLSWLNANSDERTNERASK